MPRYIDADALRKQISETYEYEFPTASGGFDEFATKIIPNIINNAITADVVPVVRGEWIMDTDPDDGDCRCSNCKVCINALHRRNHKLLNALGYKLHTFYKFCPNCGADMRGSEGKE